jgi:hypothetical protein
MMVALNGISGSAAGPTAAHQAVHHALRDGVRIIVVTEADLRGLPSGDTLTDLIKQKLGQLLTAYEL